MSRVKIGVFGTMNSDNLNLNDRKIHDQSVGVLIIMFLKKVGSVAKLVLCL